MTILLAGCPMCGSNFMLLNTETRNGHCAVCGKDHDFTDEEISNAENRRDSLSEKYLGRLEKAYQAKDAEKMAALAEEVAEEGISSWYAWFCVGWSDLQEGHVGQAFDDFKLAAYFIDEENFDEFYDQVMDAVLDSIEKTARAGEDWSTQETTMVEFTGVVFERFEHLCEQDFMCDLMTRIGAMSDSVDSAMMGGALIKEVMMIIMDYYAGNTYVMDHLNILNSAKSAIDAIDERTQEFIQDGTASPNLMKVWGKGFSEFVQIILDGEDAIAADHSEEELLSLCDFWEINDYEEVYTKFEDAMNFHTGYIVSNRHNKGILKKRDKAIKDYLDAFSRPLTEGLPQTDGNVSPRFDRICPDCGKYLTADEEGRVSCECGFRSRIPTADIDDLPENVPELVIMVKKAFEDRDSRMLNNLGERILEFDRDNWYGHFALGESCLLDGQLTEAISMFTESCSRLDYKGKQEFSKAVVEELGAAMMGPDMTELELVTIFLLPFYDAIDQSPACECNIPMRLIRKIEEGDFDSTTKISTAIMTVLPTMSHEMHRNTSLRYQRDMVMEFNGLAEKMLEGLSGPGIKESSFKTELITSCNALKDLTLYMVSNIDSKISKYSDEAIGFIAGQWAADEERYEGLVVGLMEGFYSEPDFRYNPKSNTMLKCKHCIDRYIEGYLTKANVN